MGVSREIIEAGKTSNGGFTREQLNKWGVKWPPVKGWRYSLENNMNPNVERIVEDEENFETERLDMKRLYQEKSRDFSY